MSFVFINKNILFENFSLLCAGSRGGVKRGQTEQGGTGASRRHSKDPSQSNTSYHLSEPRIRQISTLIGPWSLVLSVTVCVCGLSESVYVCERETEGGGRG